MKIVVLLLTVFGLVVGKGLTGGSLEQGTVSPMPSTLEQKEMANKYLDAKRVSYFFSLISFLQFYNVAFLPLLQIGNVLLT